MFNKNFYPTPPDLIAKMWRKVKKDDIKYILEPSAGKGDIIKYITTGSYKQHQYTVECIELDSELYNFLFSQGYNVVANDFLTFETHTKYDVVIMNPPFDNGDKHLLKAIAMIERWGGQVVCLLNAETLRNPYSKERQYLVSKLEELKADIEYVPSAFAFAERKTDVDVAMIYINIVKKLENDIVFKSAKFETVSDELDSNEGVKREDIIKSGDSVYNLIQDYTTEVEYVGNAVKCMLAYKLFLATKGEKTSLRITISAAQDYSYSDSNFNDILKMIRQKYWTRIIQFNMFKKYLTGKSETEFYQKLENQSNIEFNYNNIMQVLNSLIGMFETTIEKTAVEVFDGVKKYGYGEYSKNIYLYNGWKSNNGYKINKKIIVPVSNSWGTLYIPESIYDLEKVFNYFDGFKNYTPISRNCIEATKETEYEYFSIKAYKKGTLHLTIRRLDLLDKYNVFIGKIKKWLPNTEDIKTKEEMAAAVKLLEGICESDIDVSKLLLAPKLLSANNVLRLSC